MCGAIKAADTEGYFKLQVGQIAHLPGLYFLPFFCLD